MLCYVLSTNYSRRFPTHAEVAQLHFIQPAIFYFLHFTSCKCGLNFLTHTRSIAYTWLLLFDHVFEIFLQIKANLPAPFRGPKGWKWVMPGQPKPLRPFEREAENFLFHLTLLTFSCWCLAGEEWGRAGMRFLLETFTCEPKK